MFTYKIEKRNGDKWASNSVPLSFSSNKKREFPNKTALENIPEGSFPELKDFSIELKDIGGQMGNHISFRSAEHGIVGSFPWWDNAEQRLKQMTGPLTGSPEHPFVDVDQSWSMLIFKKDGYVYILEGDGEDDSKYNLYYRVPSEIYEKQWNILLESCKKI